jgi:hypothetical protein
MKSKGLLTASFILLVLTGIVWWSNKKAATAEKSPVESTTTRLVNIPEDQFQEIEIKKRLGENLRLPSIFPADPDAVSCMLSSLSSLSSDRTIEDKATSLEPYGLAQPALELNITDRNKKSVKLLLGDDTPAGSAVYAALAGDPRVFVLSSYKKTNFDKSANDLRDKRLLAFDVDKVTSLELTGKKQTVTFGRSKDEWQIVKPKPFRADRSQVEELLRTLHDTKMELSSIEEEKKVSVAFSSGTPFASAKVTDISGAQEIQVRKNKDDYYAKSSAVAGLYKISSTTGTGLDRNIEDFKNKKLFDFGFSFSDPDKIELHDGSKSYFLTRSGGDWWSNGTKMDSPAVSSLIDKIRDLAATKFPESGFDSPALDLTITTEGGKRIEKVQISKKGDSYVAKRENEPALYELTPSAVGEIQKSAAELKPAAPPVPATKK